MAIKVRMILKIEKKLNFIDIIYVFCDVFGLMWDSLKILFIKLILKHEVYGRVSK